mgnify:CR=1 FL=1
MYVSSMELGLLGHIHIEAALWDMFGSQEIPVYPALQKIIEREMAVNGVTTKMVLLRGEEINISQVVNYYKTALPQRGWQLQDEQARGGNIVALQFVNKDMLMLSIDFIRGVNFGKSDNHLVVRILQTLDKLDLSKSNVVDDRDMPGFDIQWLKRYPNSIRVNSVKAEEKFMSVHYNIVNYSCIQCVEEFYKQQMIEQGWKLVTVRHQTKEDLQTMIFSAKESNGLVNRISETIETQTNVSLSKEKLHQLIENNIPEEMKTLIFQKDKDLCTISIMHTSSQQASEGDLDAKEPQISSDSNQNLTSQIGRRASRAGVEIGILYIPTLALKARSQK